MSLKRFIPILSWLPDYNRERFRSDLAAGLTTAVMLIPQAMAYAALAGLPPTIGLYASIVPLAIYALLGTSRELAVGPVAMVSLLVATGVGALAAPGTPEYLTLAILLSLMVGVMQLVMGLARLGFLVNFLSHPVISGFTSAAALIIGFSQLKHLMGVPLERSSYVHETLYAAATHIGETNLVTLLIGASAIAIMMLLKRIKPVFPRALVVVLLGTLAVYLFGLDVAIVGDVPAGFPALSLPGVETSALSALLPTALVIALVGFMESISVAKAFARKAGYEVDANQELVALGAANLGGSVFSAYPVTGGFSRTAVNAQAGAKSGMASLITAATIAVALLFLTPLFYFLPKAILAAIIMTAVFGLIDVAEVKHLWHVKKSDLVLLAITFFTTLGLGIEEGILIGVGSSLLYHVVRTTRPHYAILGRLPRTEDVWRNVKNYPEATPEPGVVVMRFDAQLYFGNINFFKDIISQARNDHPDAHTFVLDASAINQLDASADSALRDISNILRRGGVRLFLASVKRPVYDVMLRSHLVDHLTEEAFFFTVEEAVQAALDEPHEVDASDDEEAESAPAGERSPTPQVAPLAHGQLA